VPCGDSADVWDAAHGGACSTWVWQMMVPHMGRRLGTCSSDCSDELEAEADLFGDRGLPPAPLSGVPARTRHGPRTRPRRGPACARPVAWDGFVVCERLCVVLRNRWLGLLVLLVLAVGTACGGSGDEASDDETGASGDIPEVVAEVNGEEISRDEFDKAYEAQQEQMQAQQQEGQPQPDEEQLREQVVQGLVTQELVLQEVERRGIEPSEEQVEQTLSELAQQNGLPSADAFRSALEEQGMDSEEIDTQLERQTAYDLLVEDEAGDVSATDQEVRALYQQFKQQQAGAGDQAQQVPPLKKIRGEVEAQVESQKESQAAQALIEQLREDADITVNL
jgi:hypothetical protein